VGGGEVELGERALRRVDARVEDEDVQPAERLDHAADRLLVMSRVVGLAGDDDRRACLQGGGRLGERLRIPCRQADPAPPRRGVAQWPGRFPDSRQ
jgi:hypothetical protein